LGIKNVIRSHGKIGSLPLPKKIVLDVYFGESMLPILFITERWAQNATHTAGS